MYAVAASAWSPARPLYAVNRDASELGRSPRAEGSGLSSAWPDACHLYVRARDRLGQWMADEQFAAAFGIRGKPGWSPSRLALVTVLQEAENLTDQLAADAVRARIDWK